MNIYLSKLAGYQLLALAAGLAALVLIVLYVIIENKPRQIILGRGGEQRLVPNTKDYVGRLVGGFSICSLAILANHWSVYILAVIVIATLVTETDFLVRIVALIWDRKEYWEYEKTIITNQQEASPDNPKLEKIADKINQDPNGLTDLLSKKEMDPNRALVNYHFERVYRQIFGSQLIILKTLMENKSPELLSLAESVYKGTSWYPNYPFDQYLSFLEDAFLIEKRLIGETEMIVLLPMGQAFLDYLNENKIPLEKQPF